MNETTTRRGFFGAIAAAMAGVGSALMFRKFRSPAANVPTPTRLLEDVTPEGNPFRVVAVDPATFAEIEPRNEVLAHPPGSREADEELLFDSDGYFKDSFADNLGPPIFDENGFRLGREQGTVSDEEYEAFCRWNNNDYPTEVVPIGSDTDEHEEEIPNLTTTRRDFERLSLPRDTFAPALAA